MDPHQALPKLAVVQTRAAARPLRGKPASTRWPPRISESGLGRFCFRWASFGLIGFPFRELTGAESVAGDVTFMQAAQFDFDRVDETCLVGGGSVNGRPARMPSTPMPPGCCLTTAAMASSSGSEICLGMS